jgi:hypothetical protein
MKFAKLAVLTAMSAVVTVSTAHAQATVNCSTNGAGGDVLIGATCNVVNTLSNTVPTVARLSIDQSSTSLTTPLASQFNGAAVNTVGPTLTVNANHAYSIASSATAWTGTGNTAKPVSDLTVSFNNGSFSALGATPMTGSATEQDLFHLSYNTLYHWTTDTPGTYSLAVTYTLTAP